MLSDQQSLFEISNDNNLWKKHRTNTVHHNYWAPVGAVIYTCIAVVYKYDLCSVYVQDKYIKGQLFEAESHIHAFVN